MECFQKFLVENIGSVEFLRGNYSTNSNHKLSNGNKGSSLINLTREKTPTHSYNTIWAQYKIYRILKIFLHSSQIYLKLLCQVHSNSPKLVTQIFFVAQVVCRSNKKTYHHNVYLAIFLTLSWHKQLFKKLLLRIINPKYGNNKYL